MLLLHLASLTLHGFYDSQHIVILCTPIPISPEQDNRLPNRGKLQVVLASTESLT